MSVPPSELPSPRARRVALPSWLDVRLVVGIALVLGSVLAGAAVVSSARRTYPRVAATRDLAAGSILSADDLTLARVQLPGRGAGVYVSRLADAVGKTLSRPVGQGELVPVGALSEAAAQTTVTVPLGSGAAPDLRKGERITLWVSTSACTSVVLLPDVTVQAVRTDQGGSFGGGSGEQDVVISVPPRLADRVVQALALDAVQVRAGVLLGPARRASELADLASCAAPPR